MKRTKKWTGQGSLMKRRTFQWRASLIQTLCPCFFSAAAARVLGKRLRRPASALVPSLNFHLDASKQTSIEAPQRAKAKVQRLAETAKRLRWIIASRTAVSTGG